MERWRYGLALLVGSSALLAASRGVAQTPEEQAEREILAQERSALDRWSQGDPLGYLDIDADEVTYFDDIAAQVRLDGRDAMRGHLEALVGKISPHRYEIVNPRVQLYGDVGILTLHYHPSTLDGEPLGGWKATSVYHRIGGEWRIVHAHWSTVEAAPRAE